MYAIKITTQLIRINEAEKYFFRLKKLLAIIKIKTPIKRTGLRICGSKLKIKLLKLSLIRCG